MQLQYERIIRRLLKEILELPETEEIGAEDDLESCGMDSIHCIQLIVAIENALDIEFPDDKLEISFVQTISVIDHVIQELTGTGSIEQTVL